MPGLPTSPCCLSYIRIMRNTHTHAPVLTAHPRPLRFFLLCFCFCPLRFFEPPPPSGTPSWTLRSCTTKDGTPLAFLLNPSQYTVILVLVTLCSCLTSPELLPPSSNSTASPPPTSVGCASPALIPRGGVPLEGCHAWLRASAWQTVSGWRVYTKFCVLMFLRWKVNEKLWRRISCDDGRIVIVAGVWSIPIGLFLPYIISWSFSKYFHSGLSFLLEIG
mmetsp:Transcript_27101/g.37191  ORF Transcript_27101/g.37191 Transcript_27101/m.37191 type:complete len:219 (+) Transcript_27101:135-791(+)